MNLVLLFLVGLIMAICTECRGQCHISKLITITKVDKKGNLSNYADTVWFKYDGKGKLVREEFNTMEIPVIISYEEKKIIYRFSPGGNMDTIQTQIFELDKSGNVNSLHIGPELSMDTMTYSNYVSNYLRPEFSFYKYDKDGYLVMQSDTFPREKRCSRHIYTWYRGNKISEKYVGSDGAIFYENIYEYSNTLPFQAMYVKAESYGRDNRNMPISSKTIQDGKERNAETCSYEFNSDGKLSKVIQKNAYGTKEVLVFYNCP